MINFISFIIGAIFGMIAILLYAYIIDKIDDRKFRKNANKIVDEITNKNILNLNYD